LVGVKGQEGTKEVAVGVLNQNEGVLVGVEKASPEYRDARSVLCERVGHSAAHLADRGRESESE
jgi:hypothetical protein